MASVRTNSITEGIAAGNLAARAGLWQAYSSADATALVRVPPLRLFVLQQWVERADHHFTNGTDNPAALTPLLYLNTAIELLTALVGGIIVMICLRRSETNSAANKSKIAGFAAFLALWFNPAVIWAGYWVPSWEIWPLPFVLLAVLFALTNGWFRAGILLTCAVMLSAASLLLAPLFLVGPLFAGKPGAAGRWLAGMLLAMTAVIVPAFLATARLSWIDVCFVRPLRGMQLDVLWLGMLSSLVLMYAVTSGRRIRSASVATLQKSEPSPLSQQPARPTYTSPPAAAPRVTTALAPFTATSQSAMTGPGTVVRPAARRDLEDDMKLLPWKIEPPTAQQPLPPARPKNGFIAPPMMLDANDMIPVITTFRHKPTAAPLLPDDF